MERGGLDDIYDTKEVLSTAPIPHLPDINTSFTANYDTLGTGFDVVLHQGVGPLAFYSKPFAALHIKVAAYERELIKLVQAVREW